MPGGVVEELGQHVEIVGDCDDRFEGVVFVFRVVDLRQRRPRAWVRGLG